MASLPGIFERSPKYWEQSISLVLPGALLEVLPRIVLTFQVQGLFRLGVELLAVATLGILKMRMNLYSRRRDIHHVVPVHEKPVSLPYSLLSPLRRLDAIWSSRHPNNRDFRQPHKYTSVIFSATVTITSLPNTR